MADLVRDHIGLRKLARLAGAAAEAALEIVEESGVEIDLAVVRAIERPHRALRRAAGRTCLSREHDELRRTVGLALLGEDVLPLHLGAAENPSYEFSGLVGRRSGAARLLLRLPIRLLIAALVAAHDNVCTVDQQPRI